MRSRTEGFVLLEAVVALAIIGMASIALLQVRGQQIRVAAQANELLTAQALAEDRLASLRLLDYDGLADPPDSLATGTFLPPFDGFEWSATVELMDDEYDLFGIAVVVTGPSERFPLNSLMHRSRPVLAAGGAAGGFGAGGRGGAARGGRAGGRDGATGRTGGPDGAGRTGGPDGPGRGGRAGGRGDGAGPSGRGGARGGAVGGTGGPETTS